MIGPETLFADPPAHAVVAITPLTAAILPDAAMRDFASGAAGAHYLASLIDGKRRRAERLAAAIARLDARQRIAFFLHDLHERQHRSIEPSVPTYPFPLSQQQIGDHLGLTPIHVNRTLSRLRADGVVTIANQLLAVGDLARLRRLAVGDPV
jgi:CRP-like cAMP-binding protein